MPVDRPAWIGLATLLRRECRTIVHYWSQTLAPAAIATTLYLLIFGEVIGKRLGSVSGVGYVQYITPGLIMLWVITLSYGHAASFVLAARLSRFLEELLISPMPNWAILSGYVLSAALRGVVAGIAVALTAACFTRPPLHSLPLIIGVMLLSGLICAAGGFITALLAKSFDQVSSIQNLILTPLTYLSGVFMSLSALPAWARKLTLADPIFYMVDALRRGFLGVYDVPVGAALAVMVVAAVALCAVALGLMARGVGIKE